MRIRELAEYLRYDKSAIFYIGQSEICAAQIDVFGLIYISLYHSSMAVTPQLCLL